MKEDKREEIFNFISYETRRQRSYLWGEYIVFKPVLVSEIFGDGWGLLKNFNPVNP